MTKQTPDRSSPRGARANAPRVAAAAALAATIALAALACAPTYDGARADPVPQSMFAPSLNVDLAAMERTPSGLYIQTLREGRGSRATPGRQVEVHYQGWLPDGRKFDSSRDRGEALEIPLGKGVVIRGWDEGIAGMRTGEVRRLVVPPELAYGEEGAGGVIPPHTPLVFEIELIATR